MTEKEFKISLWNKDDSKLSSKIKFNKMFMNFNIMKLIKADS